MTLHAQDCVPVFSAGVRLQWDRHRGRWLLQAPEKIVLAEGSAAEILRLIDGRRTLGELLATLAERYDAPVAQLHGDVLRLFDELRAEGLLR